MPATRITNPAPGESLIGIEPELLQQQSIQSQEPPAAAQPGWRHRLNLFTGRTLSVAALDSEQEYRAGLLACMGQSVTPGTVKGLELSMAASGSDFIFTVTPGYGIAGTGEDVTLHRTLQTPLKVLPVIDPSGNLLPQTFQDFASSAANKTPAGVLVLLPIVAQVSGQLMDTGTGPIEVSGNLNASCDQDPQEYAFEDWQIADGALLVFLPWPAGMASLQLPDPTQQATWRNRLAYTIFSAETKFGRDDAFPWTMLGVPVALVGFDNTWKPLFVDRASVVRAGGLPRQRHSLKPAPVTVPQWQANTTFVAGQFIADPNGNIQKVQVAGTSGSAPPAAWNKTQGQTTVDNKITWFNIGPVSWQPSTVFTVGQFIVDPNGNVQTVVTVQPSGKSGASAPAWSDVNLQTIDGGITWMNNGNGTPVVVRTAAAQARISQLSEQISDTLNQGQKFTTLADICAVMPPSGILPAAALDFTGKKSLWFPPNWKLSAGPIHTEELETALQTGMLEAVIGALPAAPANANLMEPVQVLVPLPDEVYDPNVLVTEVLDPEFAAEAARAEQDLVDTLHRRRAIQLEANTLLMALGPDSPSNPNLINPDTNLSAQELQLRNQSPPYSPGPAESFGTRPQSTWQKSTAYAAGQFVLDSNGTVQFVQTAGTSGASSPNWSATVGAATTDGGVTWVNNGSWSWQPNTNYTVGQFVIDIYGNLQTAQTAGISASTPPVWSSDPTKNTKDGIVWANLGKNTWEPETSYVVGQAILDPNGNIQVVQTGGISGIAPPFANASQPSYFDGTVTWVKKGRLVWQPNTNYAVGAAILDSNGNIEIAESAGISGKTPPSWNAAAGQTTVDAAVVWAYKGSVLWQAGAQYAAGQLIVDSNGNFQMAQSAGKSGGSQPIWNPSQGQTTTDNNIPWTNLPFVSLDVQNLRAQAAQFYAITFQDFAKSNITVSLIRDDDWNDLSKFGMQHFIDSLNRKISIANDLIDQAFLTVQTDIYRYRLNVLDASSAQKLAISPVLANIAAGDTATATAQNLQNYLGAILPSTTTPPKPTPLPPPPVGGGNPVPLPVVPFLPVKSPVQFRSLVSTRAFTVPGATAAAPAGGAGSNLSLGLNLAKTVTGVASNISGVAVAAATAKPNLTLGALTILTPGQNVQAAPADVQGQSPIPGAQLNIRTLTVAQRLQQSPSQESLFYSVGNRTSFLYLLQELEGVIEVKDLQVLVDLVPLPLPTPPAGTATPTVPVNPVSMEIHTFSEWFEPAKQPALLFKVQSPVILADSDEATLFSVGVRVLEQHTSLLRLLEGRVQQYVDFVGLCTTALNNLRNDLQQAQSLLQTLQNHLAQTRQNVAFTSSLLLDETARVNRVNAQRSQILRGVSLIAYTRPRAVENEDSATPSRQLVPANIASPVPACLQQSAAIPPELRELVGLLRESPVNWLPSIEALLNNLERLALLQALAADVQARASFLLQMTPQVSSASGESGTYAPVIASIFGAQQQTFRGFQMLRSTFQPAILNGLSWSAQIGVLQGVVALGDFAFSNAVHTEVANATTRLMQQIAGVATCLYARAGLALPVDRLAWADFLTGPGLSLQMQSLAVLPNWNTQAYVDRQQMQMLVDWLFLQIDSNNSAAVAFMSDLVRTAVLLASDVPVDGIIPSAILIRTQPVLGGLVPLALSSDRIAKGMYVQLYSGTSLAALGVVSDLDTSTVTATVTDVYQAGTFLETADSAHFTAQTPQAVALRPLLNQT
jgi:hypothetical protein